MDYTEFQLNSIHQFINYDIFDLKENCKFVLIKLKLKLFQEKIVFLKVELNLLLITLVTLNRQSYHIQRTLKREACHRILKKPIRIPYNIAGG